MPFLFGTHPPFTVKHNDTVLVDVVKERGIVQF
jgi:hypothetical protein